ncbi:MAG: hypothetical protein QM755_07540 [Luteolibacter sp.]
MSDPYLPGVSTFEPPPPPPQLPPVFRPGQIRVFGILHLVVAGLSAVMLLASVAMQGFSQRTLESQKKMGGPAAAQAEMTETFTNLMKPMTYAQYVASAVLMVALILAGIGLLKWKTSGLTWSNRYAWTSIALKICSLIFVLTYMMPKMNALMESTLKSMGGDPALMPVVKYSMIGGALLGPLFYCIYPALVLIFLNRESVRKSLS